MKPFLQRPLRGTEARPLTSSGAFHPVGQVIPSSGLLSQHRAPIQNTPQEMKRKIIQQFEKEKAEKYFKLLTQFLCGEMTKAEFDKQIKAFLTEPQRKMHNLYILTILRSTYVSLSASAPVSRPDPRMLQYIPTLCMGPQEPELQPSWERISSQMKWKAESFGLQSVDNAAVSAVDGST